MLYKEIPHEVGEGIFLGLVIFDLHKARFYLYFIQIGPCSLLSCPLLVAAVIWCPL